LPASSAKSFYRRGRHDDAERLALECLSGAGPQDIGEQHQGRATCAKVLAQRGQGDEAEQLAHDAVRLAMLTQSPRAQAARLLDLAEVLALIGRAAEAVRNAEEAGSLFAKKGHTVLAQRAEHLAGQLAGDRSA
jgi:hypothetical protein